MRGQALESLLVRSSVVLGAMLLGAGGASQAQPEVVSLPASAFVELLSSFTGPGGDPPNVEQRVFPGDIRSFDGNQVCVAAVLRVPDGTEISRMVGGFFDTHPTLNVGLELLRRRFSASASLQGEVMAQVATNDQPGFVAVSTTTISHPVIDNGLYVYYLVSQPCLEDTLAIRGVSIELSVTNVVFQDDFESGDTTTWTTVVP